MHCPLVANQKVWWSIAQYRQYFLSWCRCNVVNSFKIIYKNRIINAVIFLFQKVLPLLKGILEHSYFRYFQYNPNRKCPFWDMSKEVCHSGTCGVKPCSKNEIPDAVLSSNEKQVHRWKRKLKYLREGWEPWSSGYETQNQKVVSLNPGTRCKVDIFSHYFVVKLVLFV